MGDPAARLAQLEAELQALRAERAQVQPPANPVAIAVKFRSALNVGASPLFATASHCLISMSR